ncbi:mpv17-like protein [Scaptodrosophila lebanonensis]|uniref:Mitochondrial inner membrane protein Mpv17 n=1 Tax=Drosophila lebanonensis TaxID=7225 RepID=A0A6J2TSX7_DROLE|nr:mpv17-like protein [Scaptodrosophila lebanonensis]
MNALRGYIREGINVACIMGAGDMLAQMGIQKKSISEWDAGRTIRFSALGLLLVGPVMRKWYGTLETLVKKDQPPIMRGIKKMLWDQVCFAPPFTLALSFLVPFVNGENTDVIIERIKDKYFFILSRNYMLWPPSQIINFTFVPLNYQVIFVQCIALLWNCYLALILNKD